MLLIVVIAAVVVSLLLIGWAIPAGRHGSTRGGTPGFYSGGAGGDGCAWGVMHVFDGDSHDHGSDVDAGGDCGGSDGGGDSGSD
jgi:hypothetical protein